MNRVIVILFCILGTIGFSSAQSWEDSLRLGKQLYQSGNYKRAYKTLVNAQQLAPENIDLSKDIGNAAYKAQQYKVAENAYQIAASKTQNDAETNAKFWHNIGNCKMQIKDYQSAIESYKKALLCNPNADKTRYNLALAQQKLTQQKRQQSSNQKQSKKNQQQKGEAKQQNKKTSSHNQDKQQNKEKSQKGNTSKIQKQNLAEQQGNQMLQKLLDKDAQTRAKIRTKKSVQHSKSESGKQW